MKIVFISDTHGRHHDVNIPKGDLLIHAGDLSSRGKEDEIDSFLDWFKNQPHKYKIFIAGNHDFFFEKETLKKINAKIPDTIIYLNDSGIEIEGIKRSWIELQNCDQVLLIVDDQRGLNQQELDLIQRLPVDTAVTIIYNKIDLTQRAPEISADENGIAIYLSAKQNLGIDLLRQHLKKGRTP